MTRVDHTNHSKISESATFKKLTWPIIFIVDDLSWWCLIHFIKIFLMILIVSLSEFQNIFIIFFFIYFFILFLFFNCKLRWTFYNLKESRVTHVILFFFFFVRVKKTSYFLASIFFLYFPIIRLGSKFYYLRLIEIVVLNEFWTEIFPSLPKEFIYHHN